MQLVQLTIISHLVFVIQATLGIPSLPAIGKQLVIFNLIFLKYNILILVPPRVEVIDPCNPSPCGSNAVCSKERSAASCQCIPEYFGDPYIACRPECVVHSDCPFNKACKRNKCIDPCPGTCGINAECQVRNHIPICTCITNYIGDPFTACKQKPISKLFFYRFFQCLNSTLTFSMSMSWFPLVFLSNFLCMSHAEI